MESLQGIEAGKVQEFKYLRESGQSDGECQRDSRARAKCLAVCFRDGSNDRKTGDVLLCVTILMDTLKKKASVHLSYFAFWKNVFSLFLRGELTCPCSVIILSEQVRKTWQRCLCLMFYDSDTFS